MTRECLVVRIKASDLGNEIANLSGAAQVSLVETMQIIELTRWHQNSFTGGKYDMMHVD